MFLRKFVPPGPHASLQRVLGGIVFAIGLLLPFFCPAQISDPTYEDSTIIETLDSAGEPEEALFREDERYYDEGSNYSPPPVQPVPLRTVSNTKWDDATNGLDYTKDIPKPEKENKQNPSFNPGNWNVNTAGIGQILQVLAILLALAAIGYGIYRTLQAPKNRRIGQAEDGTIITAENVDAYIHETDLERFLREALAEGNYPLCIRLYYLQTIKVLSEKGVIQWSREKTNRDYLRETKDYRLGSEFRNVTRTFERVWYGNEALDAAAYAVLEPEFKGFLGVI